MTFKFEPDRGPRRAHALGRVCFACARAAVKKQPVENFLDKADHQALAIYAKGIAPVGTTTTSGFASEVMQTATRDFLASLGPYAGSRIVAAAVPVVIGPIASASYPQRTGDPTALSWVDETGAIPVRQYEFGGLTIGPLRKLATILAWSEELNKRTDAATIFDRMLREDAAVSLDAALFSTDAGSASAHAGLLNGVTPTTSSTANGRTAIEEDLATLAETVAAGGTGDFIIAMNPKRLARLRVMAPDLAEKLDIAPSTALADDRVVAIDAQGLLIAVDDAPDIFASKYGTVHMSTEAAQIVASATTADPVRSLWQTGAVAFRAIFEVSWAKRRSNVAAFCDDVAWW